jgi:Probable cobalt transporter subunit (CbtA)
VEKRLIVRGLVTGALAAALAFIFARLFAEPAIGRAIAFENGRVDAENAQGVHEHGAELFTRGVQANVGLGLGVLAFGVAMGALFAVAFCLIYGRVGDIGARSLSVRLAAAAFVVVYLVPFVKYPANPPAVGQAETVGARTGWYLVAVLTSVVLAAIAVWLARVIAALFGGLWNAGLLSAGAYVLVMAAVLTLLPTVHEVPEPLRNASGAIIYPGFPADVLYEFRLVAVATQLVLWVTIGLVFGTLAGRLLAGRASSSKA